MDREERKRKLIQKLKKNVQIDSRDSFENVSTKWITEITENCPGVKVVLTALKCDLRKDEDENENLNAITFDQGLAKAKEIGAVKYLGKYLLWGLSFKGKEKGLRGEKEDFANVNSCRMLRCPKSRY